MDENAKIFRNDVWFNPPIPPAKADKITAMYKNQLLGIELWRTVKGAIFCHVIKIIHSSQLRFAIISGNQKWNGAAPTLIMILVMIIILVNSWINKGDKKIKELIITENNKVILPILWVKK